MPAHKKEFIATPHPNRSELDSIFDSIESLIQAATSLGVDPMRVKTALDYWRGKYGKK